MKLKNSVKEIIAPELNKCGFLLTEELPRFYCLRNDTSKISVYIEAPPHCPFYLFTEYSDILAQREAGNKDIKSSGYVTFQYVIDLPNGEHISISSHMFEPFMNVSSGFVYCNSKDLELKSHKIVNELITIVIPFVESFAVRFVDWTVTQDWQERLQFQSKFLAQHAADLLHLPNNRKEGYTEIERALFCLRGTDEAEWKKVFCSNNETIVCVAAYLGECIEAYAASAEWLWETTPRIVTSSCTYEEMKTLYLRVKYVNGHQSIYNLLEIIRDLWNYAPHIKCRHIESIVKGIK